MVHNIETHIYKDKNQATILLHDECYSRDAILSFANESSPKFSVNVDKENHYFKLMIYLSERIQDDDVNNIINQINDYQLRFDLMKRTEQIRNTIVDFAFGKKKLIDKVDDWSILPFNFKTLEDSSVLVTSYTGEFLFLSHDSFKCLTTNNFKEDSSERFDLIQTGILTDSDVNLSINLAATKYRSRKAFLNDFTSLHMVVLTKGCNCNCRYCQVSSLSQEQESINMSKSTSKRVVDMIFNSPSNTIKIEFQGGEPLINWETLKFIVDYSLWLNKIHKKRLEFVLCTNLLLMDEEKLEFIKANGVLISTSLDGPKEIHDTNRPCRNGQSSYDLFIEKLKLVRKNLGRNACSPLVTLTKDSLPKLKGIIDEYRKLGFSDIFLRPVNPYGNAKNGWNELACNVEDFLQSYKEALNYIIDLNIRGEHFVEYYTLLLLSRILTPFSTGFVDLQSPSGVGISGVIYDYNGDVYPSDEARMLARMGDTRFKLGNVLKNKYDEIFQGDTLKNLTKSTTLEALPGCTICVYQPFCGADPIRYYVESGQIQGYRPTSDFCRKNRGIFDYLFSLIKDDNSQTMDVFWSWLTNRSLSEVQL